MSCGNVSKQSIDPQLGCPRCGVNGSMVVLFIPHCQRREFRAVNRDFASSLIQLNNTFYREHSASFSDTRQAPWPGWVRTMDIALEQLDVATIEHPVRVFDLACGNMRFENFAAGGTLAAKGVDGTSPSADASCRLNSTASTRAKIWLSMRAATPCAFPTCTSRNSTCSTPS